MKTITKDTIVLIKDTSKIKRSNFQQPCYTERYKNTLHRITRTTKAGWYLITLQEHGNPTISIPKKHLEIFEPKLSSYGLTLTEIDLFRQLRLVLNGYWSKGFELQELEFYSSELLQALEKLGYKALETSTMASVTVKLPFFNYYWCK